MKAIFSMPSRLILALLALTFSVTAYAQGPGNAMYANSDSARAFNLGRALTDSLATTNFTVELWLKVATTGNKNNPTVIGTKDWGSGVNPGFAWAYITPGNTVGGGPANGLRFNFATSAGSSSRRDVDMVAANAYEWNHYAITVDRSGTIKGYINGVLKVTSTSIAGNAAQSIASSLPAHIAQDGTGNFPAKLSGTIDEVRIWKTVRTEQELRDNMCRTLAGSENGLLAYYRLDEAPGSTTIANSATATAGLFQGTATAAAPEIVASGAPVGDASVNIYTNNWNGQSLSLTTTDRGNFTVDSFGKTGSYLHLYRIDAAPQNTDGLTPYGDNNVIFGTFASGDTFVYYPKYDYANYPSAVTFETGSVFFGRRFNDDARWSYKPFVYKNTTNKTVRVDSTHGTRQFFLGNMVSGCTGAPSALDVPQVFPESAVLGWTSSAVLWNIQYGPAGFTPGTGTIIRGAGSNPYTLRKLLPETTYSFYVQDTCMFLGTSNWVGPYTFTTERSYAGIGSGYALQCDNTSSQAFNLGKAMSDSLDKTDFTLEMWVKVDPTSTVGNPPLLANKDYVSGNNNGICWTYSASSSGPGSVQIPGSFRFNFKTHQGTTGSKGRHDYDIKPVNPHVWNHIAMTVNRRGEIRGYVNGVYQANMYNNGAGTGVGNPDIAADSARSLATNALDMYLAQDGTGNYSSGYFFKGNIDEVRIWSRVLDSNELRTNMCRTLTGAEAGLLAYYRLDDGPGSNEIVNGANATSGQFNGIPTVTPPAFVVSGAPIGDTSTFLYTTDWTGKSLELSVQNRGGMSIDSFQTTGSYLHLYRIDSEPNFTGGLTDFSVNDVQYGVFDGGDGSFTYFPRYDYSDFDSAVDYRQSIHLSGRPTNADSSWVGKGNLYNDTLGYVLRAEDITGTHQFFLTNFNKSCDTPSALVVKNLGSSYVEIEWVTGGSAFWNIEYGLQGFTPGTGTAIKGVSSNPYTIRNLDGRRSYDVYVQDSCVGIGSSNWVGPVSFTTLVDYASIGGGYALRFHGNGVTNGPSYGVNLGTAIRDSLAYSDFTIEMWVRVHGKNTNNPSLIASKDYVSGLNTGISLNYAAPGNSFGSAPGHHYRFNITTQGGARHDYDVPSANEYVWNHIAFTVDRKGKIRGYVNGVYHRNRLGGAVGSDDIAVDSARSLAAGALPFYLGTDGTGNYRSPFSGDMDEVRIWNRVLDSNEIRAAMCHKLEGNEPGLIAYYRMDEESGNVVYNSAAATAGLFNGTFTVNKPTQEISSAPIGDTSVYIYPNAGWDGVNLQLNSNGQGIIVVDSITAITHPGSKPVPGVHIYRIGKAPNYTNGIADLGGTDRYFGVFTADNASAYYRAEYDYATYPAATTNAANLHLYNRRDNADSNWAQMPVGTAATSLFGKGFLGSRQYLLADFAVSPNCVAPANIQADTITNSTAAISWSSSAGHHISKFGVSGFDRDTVSGHILTVNNQALANLLPNTYYDLYLQDSCGAGNKSAWVGPFTFATQGECVTPVNVHADNITDSSLVLEWIELGQVVSSYGIAWGEKDSFTHPDSATYLPVFASSHLFERLTPKTTYTFYIKTFCNSVYTPTTGWVGPFHFTTADTASDPISVRGLDAAMQPRVYPNPAAGMISIDFPTALAAEITSVSLYSNLGVLVETKNLPEGNAHVQFDVSTLPDGVYHLQFRLRNAGRLYKAVVVKH